MKFMKIALSVVAIAAIATIYSTGAFVSKTPGLDNTVDGFLAISNAEMAQQVGGENGPSEGIPFYKPRQDHGKWCSNKPGYVNCKTNFPGEENVKKVRNAYYMCDPCRPPMDINLFNIQLNDVHWPKYSRLTEDGEDYSPTHKRLRLECRLGDNGKCFIHETGIDGTFGNCLRWIGICDD